MEYYNVTQVMEITGVKENKAYQIIRELNKTFKRRFPDSISIQGKIPKWFFNECMGQKKTELTTNESSQ